MLEMTKQEDLDRCYVFHDSRVGSRTHVVKLSALSAVDGLFVCFYAPVFDIAYAFVLVSAEIVVRAHACWEIL